MNTDIFLQAYKYALSLLSRKDYSQYKLTLKLRQKNFSTTTIDEVIQRLLEKNYLNEKNYVNARISALTKKNYSTTYIFQKLTSEHLPITMDEVTTFFHKNNLDENTQILNLINKKLNSCKKTPSNPEEALKFNSKVLNYLSSKGHCSQKCITLLRHLQSNNYEISSEYNL